MSYQHAVVGSGLAGQEGEHDAEVGVLELQPQGAAHLPPQRALLIGVARQSHGHHVQVQVSWGPEQVRQAGEFTLFSSNWQRSWMLINDCKQRCLAGPKPSFMSSF